MPNRRLPPFSPTPTAGGAQVRERIQVNNRQSDLTATDHAGVDETGREDQEDCEQTMATGQFIEYDLKLHNQD